MRNPSRGGQTPESLQTHGKRFLVAASRSRTDFQRRRRDDFARHETCLIPYSNGTAYRFSVKYFNKAVVARSVPQQRLKDAFVRAVWKTFIMAHRWEV